MVYMYHLGADDLGIHLGVRFSGRHSSRPRPCFYSRHPFPALSPAHDLHVLRFLIVAVAVDIGIGLVLEESADVFHVAAAVR